MSNEEEHKAATRSTRLRRAAAIVETVAAELDTRSQDCARCGKPTYRQFEEWRLFQQLDGIVDKLTRIASQIPEQCGETPRKEHDHGNEKTLPK